MIHAHVSDLVPFEETLKRNRHKQAATRATLLQRLTDRGLMYKLLPDEGYGLVRVQLDSRRSAEASLELFKDRAFELKYCGEGALYDLLIY